MTTWDLTGNSATLDGGAIYNNIGGAGVMAVSFSSIADLASLSPPDPMAVLSGDITPRYALLGASQALNAGNPAACVNRAG